MVPLRVSGTMCWWDRGPREPGRNGAGSLRKAGEEGAGGGFLKAVGKPIEAEPLRGGGRGGRDWKPGKQGTLGAGNSDPPAPLPI